MANNILYIVEKEELKKIVSRRESEQVEFKRSTSSRLAAVKTVCAMLNGVGGHVIFGVSDLN